MNVQLLITKAHEIQHGPKTSHVHANMWYKCWDKNITFQERTSRPGYIMHVDDRKFDNKLGKEGSVQLTIHDRCFREQGRCRVTQAACALSASVLVIIVLVWIEIVMNYDSMISHTTWLKGSENVTFYSCPIRKRCSQAQIGMLPDLKYIVSILFS